ncbi:MAG: putative phage tail protein [Myxococcota bacterium]
MSGIPKAPTIARYTQQALALLPPGRALSRRVESVVHSMAEAVAVPFARVHDVAEALRAEMVPPEADVVLLEDWEKAAGLPNCEPAPSGTDARQAALVSHLVASGGQAEPDFQEIGEALGFETGLHHEHLPATCVSRCTDPVADIAWAFHKRVVYDGEGDDLLKCRFRQHAHLYGSLAFEELEEVMLALAVDPRNGLQGGWSSTSFADITTGASDPTGGTDAIDAEDISDTVRGIVRKTCTYRPEHPFWGSVWLHRVTTGIFQGVGVRFDDGTAHRLAVDTTNDRVEVVSGDFDAVELRRFGSWLLVAFRHPGYASTEVQLRVLPALGELASFPSESASSTGTVRAYGARLVDATVYPKGSGMPSDYVGEAAA